ncbi:MAG: O-antigen ligase [Coleofasciculaceae cyanobacterium]
MRTILKLAEKGFTLVTLLLSTEAFISLLPHAVRQLIWFSVYAISLFLLVLRWKQSVRVAMRGSLLWFFLGIVLFSIFWSDAPSITFRQSFALFGTTLFGLYLATRYSMREQLQLLALVLGIAAFLSLVFAVALPAYGLQGGQSWQGIYHHKNILGRMMILSSVVFALMVNVNQERRWLPWAGFGLSSILLVLSNSKTALALYLILLALLPLYRALRLYYKLAVPAVIACILTGGGVSLVILSSLESVLDSAGKDLTLSGRTGLWGLVIDMIEKRPWLGYGYGGFWRGWDGASAYVWSVEWWYPLHSHNGYLDLWLDLGFVGILAYALSFLLVMRRAIVWVRLTKTPEYLLPLSYLTFLFLYNLTESVILHQNTIFWILYVAFVFSRISQRNRFLEYCSVDDCLDPTSDPQTVPRSRGKMQNA